MYKYNWTRDIRQSTVSDYQRDGRPSFDNRLLLKPGVAEQLVRLNAILRPLFHREWSRMVATMNGLPEDELERFLFGAGRAPLDAVRERQTPRAGVGVTYVRTPGPVRSCARGRRRGHARPRRSPFVAGRLDRRGGTDARNGRLALPGPRGPGRRRRDGRGLSGRGHAPGAQGRPEGPAGRAHARRTGQDPLHRGGARRLAARPPHICAVHDIDDAGDGRLLIAMAYCDGETLRARMGRGSLPVTEAVNLACQLADGLAERTPTASSTATSSRPT